MTPNHEKYLRILAVSPSMWGFGFVVLEGNSTLVDWDAKVTSGDKNAWCIKEVDRLIGLYAPDALALYDYSAGSKRSPRIQKLNNRLAALAKKCNLAVESFTPGEVMRTFLGDKAGTKHDIAKALAGGFSDELAFRLPPKRTAWMNQDRRMDIFDAAALAMALRMHVKDRPGT
jgi:hypothetical protein